MNEAAQGLAGATADPATSAGAIQHHYDVGNDFFALFLDRLCTYSCPIWNDEDDTDLDAAQIRKIDWYLDHTRARGTQRLLDIGCGWGGLMRRAADDGVAHVVGLTLSKAQLAHNAALGHPRIEVRLESWFDHRPDAFYDAIISLGAFEHFARIDATPADKLAGYRAYFERCHAWLRPGGWMGIQTVAWGNMGREDLGAFVKNDLFPESDLPRLAELCAASERLFEPVLIRNDRSEYERTHRIWLANLKANRARAVELVGEATVKHFEKYLKISIVGFHTGKNDLIRMILRRIDRPHHRAAT